jgi:hypothetical protein
VLFGQSREEMRRLFIDSWNKHLTKIPMEPIEERVAAVIAEHPEYHPLLEKADAALSRDYLPEFGETNPFLHMAMHIALREQLSSNRPQGIADIYRRLLVKHGHPHEVEHRMAECLGETLWHAQRENKLPDEAAYLECLQRL